VVLLDVEIPGDSATVTLRRIHQLSPRSQVIILSMYDGPDLLRSLLEAGIRGYLLKSASREELLSAIRGTRTVDGPVRLSVSSASLAAVQSAPGQPRLSQRERQVLQLAAEALSNVQIGHRLGLTEATVKRHLSNIYIKLDAVSRIDAVNKAVAASLITTPKSAPRQVSRGE
jgi:DNA-binding NarL/FixJ family response regulator